jgi:small subunit ribosomal protein S7
MPSTKNKLVSKFIASIMRDGKKSVAESLLYGAFDIISEKTNEDPLKVFEKRWKMCAP